jgi:PEP-CTERM motif
MTDPSGTCSTGITPGCLQDGDLAVIYARAQQTAVPEPATWTLLATGILLAMMFRKRTLRKIR